MTRRFEIERTPEMLALVDKHTNYGENYFGTDDDVIRAKVLAKLDPWEQIAFAAYLEHPSIKKFARFFGVTDDVARMTIGDMKDKIRVLTKRERRLNND